MSDQIVLKRAARLPPTDGELVAVTTAVASAVANLRSVAAASEAARQQFPERPRAMYLTPEQLEEAYRRAGLRNPRTRADTTNARTLIPRKQEAARPWLKPPPTT
jgi:hypothetical protein